MQQFVGSVQFKPERTSLHANSSPCERRPAIPYRQKITKDGDFGYHPFFVLYIPISIPIFSLVY